MKNHFLDSLLADLHAAEEQQKQRARDMASLQADIDAALSTFWPSVNEQAKSAVVTLQQKGTTDWQRAIEYVRTRDGFRLRIGSYPATDLSVTLDRINHLICLTKITQRGSEEPREEIKKAIAITPQGKSLALNLDGKPIVGIEDLLDLLFRRVLFVSTE